ncbi:protein kinase [Sorangium sp. So ce321]|uniref:nSTAND1 domain-containing NTPase n=1 Tax=Sorangium sp. So ce321 TaxID=3133300 RepID=UPI003F620188
MHEPALPGAPPREFEEYRLIRLLGRGAMGEVFLAHDTALDRPVAIKFIAGIEPDARARQRFFLEARAIARVRHPNVVAIHRIGEVRRRPYLVSEYVAGTGLDALDKPVPPRSALAIACGLARGLAAAHRQGVLHRDIKPANAVLEHDGTVKLLDFGLAELTDPRAQQDAVAQLPALAEPLAPDGAPAATAAHRLGSPGAPPSAGATVSLSSTGSGLSDRQTSSTLDTDAPRTFSRRRRIAGTPLYMAPELWGGAPASPRSDIYALGALLYELCAGAAPHEGVAAADLPRVACEVDAQPLIEVAPTVDAALAGVIQRCLARRPSERFASGDDLCSAFEALVAPRRTSSGERPYRGLLAFDAQHSAMFYGRSAEVRALLDRLRVESFVLVTGDSGVGKSSLCRAGLLPAAALERLDGRPRWATIELVPGKQPLLSLASAFAALLDTSEGELARALHRDPAELGRRLRERPSDTATLVLVDQLEEILTLPEPSEAALAALALGGVAIRASGVRLVATARSDFLTRLTSLPELGDHVARSLFLVRAMSEADLREAIVGPALAAGFRFERDETVDEFVVAARSAPGGLPLLQFTLAELWERRDLERKVLPASALEAMGGVTGTLAKHADGVLEALLPAERRAAQRVLMALVTAEGTRARRSVEELVRRGGEAEGAAVRSAIDAMVRGRLLVARQSDDGRAAFEIAHEALLERWDTLRGWLSRDAELLALRQRLERAALEWQRLREHPAALWGRVQLAEVRELPEGGLDERERRFLAASRRAARRRRFSAIAVATAAMVAVAGAYTSTFLKARADLERRLGDHVVAAELAAGAARRTDAEVDALRAEALATYVSQGSAAGEGLWAHAHTRVLGAEQAYQEASREIEAALAREDSPAMRARLGDVTLARLLSAERDRRFADRDTLMFRLSFFDPGGARRASLDLGGHLTLRTAPPAAAVLRRYQRGEDGKLTLDAPRALGETPIAELALAQGSYMLELTAPDRAPVRYPFLVGRAERVAIDLELPRPEQVLEGFVYVPPGPFLFGSAEPDPTIRSERYFAMPIHRAETGAYLIARVEVTFEDWIRYLEALSAGERARRTPRGRDHSDDLTLDPIAPGRWRLTFQDGRVRYSAVTGEPYVGRGGRRGRWERFPVVGISQEDAAAYAAWRDATGRTPGARLCDEREWERAGRGADGRLFPMGERLPYDMANISPVEGHDPDGFDPREVGSYPASRSPFGVDDLSGNAAEYTLSMIERGAIAQRSGTWFQGAGHARLDRRYVLERSIRHPRVGFRLCATPRQGASALP